VPLNCMQNVAWDSAFTDVLTRRTFKVTYGQKFNVGALMCPSKECNRST
jgi:hypothetical protein